MVLQNKKVRVSHGKNGLVCVQIQLYLSHKILAARQEGEQLGGDGTAKECEQGNDGDGQPYGQLGGSHIASDDVGGDGCQEEHVHKVHAKCEFCQRLAYMLPFRTLRGGYAREE